MSSTPLLTFNNEKDLINSSLLVGPDARTAYYTISTTFHKKPFRLERRHTTTITSVSTGLVGSIDWEEKVFVINGLGRRWDDVRVKDSRKRFFFTWADFPTYKLEFHDRLRELTATPVTGGPAVQFRGYHPKPFHMSQTNPASISFPHQMQDEVEKMFLLISIVYTDVKRLDAARAAAMAVAVS
ncbi:hypothetical protein R3P38DRAFT_1886854 [Favolaschia claudopus]|uniref:Uncharacterized protein n=1 Tax=Favolaschia claudopus TaxID=2862362 RepID=A0AAW0DAM8_9AGAR